MNWQFRAIAIDYDGTLASAERPNSKALEAIKAARKKGLRSILVTGRILAELYDVFPDVDEHFDALVIENGAAFCIEGGVRLLSAPVAFELDEALVGQAVVFRRGQVLLASHARYEDDIQHEIRRLGLECQAIRNRDELMILPAAVSKGSGLVRALQSLGISAHSTLAFGDAENDHSLLAVCEIGVAVGNAVEGLKRHADVVLEAANGIGIAQFIHDAVLRTKLPLLPRRWQIRIGEYADGQCATLPASLANILIAGRSKSGKSHLGGSIAEDLIELGYSVCLLDPEGDHGPLADLQGVQRITLTNDDDCLDNICEVIQQHFGSVVIDMSELPRAHLAAQFERAFNRLQENRTQSGLPHWIIVDEAHIALGDTSTLTTSLKEGSKGFCLITYQPELFTQQLANSIDTVLVVPGGAANAGSDPLEVTQRLMNHKIAPQAADEPEKQAWVYKIDRDAPMMTIRLHDRVTTHVRHRHKYADAPLTQDARFRFSDAYGSTISVAHNVSVFVRVLDELDHGPLQGHIQRGDFSRWISDVLQDDCLAREVAEAEAQSVNTGEDLERVRAQILRAINRRYTQ